MAPQKASIGKAAAPSASSRMSKSQTSKAKSPPATKRSSPNPKSSIDDLPPRYPQCLREAWQQVNQYFIPVVDKPLTHFVLGPIYHPTAPAELPTYYPVNCDEPLLLSLPGLHWTGWKTKGTIRSWASVFPAWKDWVTRMKTHMLSSWRELDLYEAIDLSTQKVEFNPNLIAAAACFWSTSSNAFIFSDGPMSPTVLDIAHLTGLSSVGVEVNAALDHQPYDPPFEFGESSAYANFLATHRGPDHTIPTFSEKVAFYLFWINKYLLCVSGLKVTKEYLRLAICLAQGTKLALAPFVLGTLYKGLWTFTHNKITSSCGGPFWILQAWLYAYFPCIKPLIYFPKRTDGGQCLSYTEYLLAHEPRHENASFALYFRVFYNPRTGETPNWLPFKECQYSASEKIKSTLQLLVPAPQVNEFWASILVPRFLSVGFSPSTTRFPNCSFEVYMPNQCARQFGLVQGIPVPYTHPRIKDLANTRPNVTQTSLIQELVGQFKGVVASFQFKSFVAEPSSTTEFKTYWEFVSPLIFNKDINNCLSRLDPDDNYSETFVSKPTGQSKGKKTMTSEDLPTKKRTRSSQLAQDPPLMVDAMKGQTFMSPLQVIAEDSEVLAHYKKKVKRKLRMPASSDEDNCDEKGSTTNLLDTAKPPSPMDQSSPPATLASEEKGNTESDKIPTNSPIADNTATDPALDTLTSKDGDQGELDLNFDLAPLEQVETLPPKGTHDTEPASLNTGSPDKCPTDSGLIPVQENLSQEIEKDAEIPSTIAPILIIETETPQSPGVIVSKEPQQATEITPNINQKEVPEQNFPVASPSSVNKGGNLDKANLNSMDNPTSDLDLMLSKAKTFSESYSRSVSEFSQSLTPTTFCHLSEDTKDEVNSFFNMLELPLTEVATDHFSAFSNCVSHLISKKAFPDLEQIELTELWSSLGKNLPVAAYCQSEMKEKMTIINQYTNASNKLDSMGDSISDLKNKLHHLDVEEASLIARLGRIKEEKATLLAQKNLLNHELASITHDEQGIQAMISVTREDYLKNQSRFRHINHQWDYFVNFFMGLRSRIQQ